MDTHLHEERARRGASKSKTGSAVGGVWPGKNFQCFICFHPTSLKIILGLHPQSENTDTQGFVIFWWLTNPIWITCHRIFKTYNILNSCWLLFIYHIIIYLWIACHIVYNIWILIVYKQQVFRYLPWLNHVGQPHQSVDRGQGLHCTKFVHLPSKNGACRISLDAIDKKLGPIMLGWHELPQPRRPHGDVMAELPCGGNHQQWEVRLLPDLHLQFPLWLESQWGVCDHPPKSCRPTGQEDSD